ncbi:hypothetical protein B0T10DRAFT_193447 [Thelonectria olida]|uniref:Uncharacterized protein n=1 Tax=Thelonectria olida TaxID=1576542 RepID=A0A9P9AJC5_9HYPO|nr:hypothetical protein B0T10DRAFT_193447 [Thelonectria olida]
MTATRTNLGPLTTEFTYPSSCRVAILSCTNCAKGWQGQTCGSNHFNTQGVQDNVDCWPERSNSSISTSVALNGFGYYSPGLLCPTGYTTACQATGTSDGGFVFQFPLLQSETAVGCCPTGYKCKHNPGADVAQTCYSVATTGSFEAAQCSAGTTNDYRYVRMPATVSEVVSSETSYSTIRAITLFAPLFQLNHQKTDLSSSSTSETDAADTMKPSEESSSGNGLSTGAKAGIGAGAGVVALIVIGVALLFWRKRKSKVVNVVEKPPGYECLRPELQGKPVQPAFAELDWRASRSELA